MEEQNTQPAPSLVSHAVKHGVILGVISIVIVVLCYVVDLSMLATFKFLIFILLVGLGYVIYSGINYRGEIGGYMPYGKALQHGFLVLAISGLVSTIFNLLLYNVIDPDMPQKLTDAIIANTEEMMASFGAPQDTIDQQIATMRTEMVNNFGVFGLIKSYLMALIWYAIIALITSLFVRKNEPVEI